METPSSPSQPQGGTSSAASSSVASSSAARSTSGRRSKRTPNNVQVQQHSETVADMTSEDASEAPESAAHDHCSGTDEDSSMDVDSKSQPTERTLLPSPSDVSDSGNSDNDDDNSGSENDRQAEDTPISGLDALTGIFGGRGSFNPAMLGFGFGHTAGTGNAAQLRSLVSALKQTDDSTAQFIALQGLVELLAMSTEESFISIDVGELVQVLVNMLKDSDSNLSVNPDAVLLACRCLSNLLEALPLAGSIMCRHGAIEALCSKLFEIEYIDLAEQALLTLEHLSESFPDKICEAGGMSACLTFLDFFPTSVQRSALTCASNCAKSITSAHFSQAKDTLQVLERTMFSGEQSIASLSCTTLLYLASAFRSSSDKIEELVPEHLLKSIIEGANRDGTSFSAATCTAHLRILVIVLHSSCARTTQALDYDIIPALKSVVAHEFMLSEDSTSTTPVNGQMLTNISEQAWCALHLMVILLPQLPVDQQAFSQAEKIVARDPKHCNEELYANNRQLRRLVATVTRPTIMEQIQELFTPLAIRIFTATTDAVVRYRLLQTVLTIVFIVDADSLRATLNNVRLATFIANTLSAVDSPILLGIAMLIVRIVLGKLPGAYEAEFIREGIADSLENIASSARATLEQGALPDEASSSDRNAGGGSDAESNEPSSPESDSNTEEQPYDVDSLVSGFKVVYIHLSTASRSVLSAKLQQSTSISSRRQGAASKSRRSLLKWTLAQAQDLHDTLVKSNILGDRKSGDGALTRLRRISRRLDKTDLSHDNVALCVAEVAEIITSDSGITCYELTHSGIIEPLSRILCKLSDKAAREKPANSILDDILLQLFSCHAASRTTQRLSTTAFAILVQRLQESLCLTERLQVYDVQKSAADEAKHPIHMLTKHVRFMVSPSNSGDGRRANVAEKDRSLMDDAAMSRIRRSLHPIAIGVHAVSTFGAIEAYLRPRVALCIGVKNRAHQKAGLPTEDGTPTRLANSSDSVHRMRPQESQLVRHPDSLSSDNDSDIQSSEDAQANNGSNSGHLRLLQMIAQSSGIDLRSVGLFDSLDSQGSDDESHDSDDGSGDADNGNLSSAHVLESGQDASELCPSNDVSAPSEIKGDWRLVMVLKIGDSERVVNATETIFSVLSKVCQNDPSLRDTTNFWSTTFALEFFVEPGDDAHAADARQHRASMANRPDNELEPLSEFVAESAAIAKLLDVLYRTTWQVRARMSSNGQESGETTDRNQILPSFLPGYTQHESVNAFSKLFVNSKLDSKLRQQLGIPLVVVCSALPGWCHSLTKHAPYLLSFDARLTYLRVSSFGYTRSISYWQDLARREARRNGRPYAEAQIPLGRIQRQKVRISRPRLLDSAFKVLEMYGSAKTVLEIEYFDEAGVGNGPTLEFYSLVSRCLQESALGIWRDEGSTLGAGSSELPQYVNAPLGLFPRALGTNKSAKSDTVQSQEINLDEATLSSDRSVKMFQFIGHFVAKGLIDNRILDLPLHEEFWVAVQRHSQAAPSGSGSAVVVPWTWYQLESLDAQFAGSLRYLQQFVDAKNEIYAWRDLSMEEKQHKVLEFRDPKTHACVEDLSLDFTLPGDPTIELRPGGTDIPVTINNVDAYIDLVAQWTLHTGVCTQVAAFCEGFNRIFPVSSLSIFTPSELCTIFGPSKNSEDWSVATITSSIELGDGYSLTSPSVQMMVHLLESLSVVERREFLRFSTGSPRLPIGGFRALNPPLRLVLKANEPPLTPDDYLPSVMTCNNIIKLPVYSSFEILKRRWSQAVSEGCHSFHLS